MYAKWQSGLRARSRRNRPNSGTFLDLTRGATQARYLSGATYALQYVAGYVLINDVSEREYQIQMSGNQWSKGECCETFYPLGPSLISAHQVADVQSLSQQSWVNGGPRQDSSTSDMVHGVAAVNL